MNKSSKYPREKETLHRVHGGEETTEQKKNISYGHVRIHREEERNFYKRIIEKCKEELMLLYIFNGETRQRMETSKLKFREVDVRQRNKQIL